MSTSVKTLVKTGCVLTVVLTIVFTFVLAPWALLNGCLAKRFGAKRAAG
jgi:hypothetical protein